MKKPNLLKLNRNIHYWLSAVVAIPLLIVIITGILLLLRKEIAWVQPPTQKTANKIPTITFEQVLTSAKTIPPAKIKSWSDIDRLDIRPGKGIIKIQSKNRWEIQIDQSTGKVLQTAYRRSGLIESLHDGTFWGRKTSYFIFLPAAIILLILWITGIYMFIKMLIIKSRKKKK